MKKNNTPETLFWLFCMVLLFYITVVLPILMLFYDAPLVASGSRECGTEIIEERTFLKGR